MLSKLRRWLREGLILLALLAGAMLLMDAWRAAAPCLFDSTPLQTLDGETVTLAALSKDEPVLLYFWASWCGVCRFTTPEVARLRSEGENVMTIALRSGNEAEVSRWLLRKGVEFPVINDANGAISAVGRLASRPRWW
jgi:thiol-disulfide isomerase/thioredoxin